MKFNFTFMRCMAVLVACFTAFSLQAQSDATVTITAPASVAGDYAARQAVFGPGLTTDISGAIVEGVDTAGLTTVCDSIGNDLTGAIALVDRGACGFVDKVLNSQTKGAIAAIVCNNNQDAPNQAIVMGGDDMGAITIPSVMLSYNQCQTIRAELANGLAGTLTISNLIPSPTGTVCADPVILTDGGTYTATLDEGYGGVFGGSGNAAWYSYTPSQDTLITVTSCSTTDVDTRLIVVDSCTSLNVLAFNDDCAADNFSSELTWLGIAGTEYLILWDDRWSGDSFDWDLILEAPPQVDVTVTVDMNAEAADNGGYILGSFNGWSSTEMTDNMDGTYSYTITGLTAGTPIEYLFQNGGPDDQEMFAQGAVCTITDPSGTFTNRLLVPGIENSSLAAVCFNSCEACPPPACTDPDAIICDDMEDYTVDLISAQASHWLPWGGTAGAADDAIVSTDFAASGSQSLLVSEANGDDMLLLLGDQTTGNYLLTWKMYVPDGSTGYFNTQKEEGNPGGEFGMQVEFFADGTSTLDAGAADIVTYDWESDTWMELSLYVDLTNDWMTYRVNGVEIYSWPASWETFTESGTLQLGAVNFFGNAGTTQYIDDVLFKALPECLDDAIICESYEAYESGVTTGGLTDFWTTWSGTFGTDEDGIVSDVVAFDGNNSMLIANNGIQDVLLLLGNQTEGNWRIEMQMYVPTDNIGYYNIQDDETPGQQWNMEAWFNGSNTSTYTPGMGQLASGETFTVPQDQWFMVASEIDLDNRTHTFTVDGNVVLDAVNYPAGDKIGALDFFSISDEHTAYFDAIRFVQLEPVVVEPDPVDVTFNVNMANETVAADGVFIAGEFNGWPNPGDAMTDNADGTYSITVQLIPGDTVEYKYQNGADGWEGNFSEDDCGLNNNRFVIVGDMAMDTDLVCFNECADCTVGAEDLVFQNSINVFPNPASDLTNITFDFAESNDITIELVNKLGQRISFTELGNIQNASHELTVNNLAAGMYFIHISNGEASMVEKLFVE